MLKKWCEVDMKLLRVLAQGVKIDTFQSLVCACFNERNALLSQKSGVLLRCNSVYYRSYRRRLGSSNRPISDVADN